MRPFVCLLFLAAALIAGLTTACSEDSVRIDVARRVSRTDTVVPIRIEGLSAGESVTLRAETSRADGEFVAEGSFRADKHGTVDLTRDPSRGNDYKGVFPMGILASMHVTGTADGEWPVVELTALVDGESVAETSMVRRNRSQGVRLVKTSVAEQGFYGHHWLPKNTQEQNPAVIVIGGAEGGLSGDLEAQLLASRGFPALALAYFDEAGLPDQLQDIPLEYFETAIRWFAEQPGVDPDRIVIVGTSRGSEVAQLLGVHFPELVRAVVARVPSNIVVCGRFPSCSGDAWTLDGEALPYEQGVGPDPANAEAVIPVERIRAPLFTVCGGEDQIWPSCPMAEAIADRRNQHDVGKSDVVLTYPEAGHGVGAMVPNTPVGYREPVDPAANAMARADAWPKYLAFLEKATM